jgi:hypothetical protein
VGILVGSLSYGSGIDSGQLRRVRRKLKEEGENDEHVNYAYIQCNKTYESYSERE